MKKTSILAAGLLCLLAAGCAKDSKTLDSFMLKDANFTDTDSKMHLAYGLSGNSALSYDNGDVVHINGTEFTINKVGGTWKAQSSSTISAEHFYAAYSDGTVSDFSGTTHRFDIRSNVATTKGIVLAGSTDDHNLTLTPACAILRVPLGAAGYSVKVGFEGGKIPSYGIVDGSTGRITTATAFLNGVSQPSPGVYAGDFLNMVADASNNYYIGIPIPNSSVETYLYLEWSYGGGSPTRYRTSGRVTLQPGYVYTVGTSRVAPFHTDGRGKGLFNVASKRQVRFSPGNLQCQPGTVTYRFAPNQYTSIGNGYGNTHIDYFGTEWMDLFGWACSGYDAGQNYDDDFDGFLPSCTPSDEWYYYAGSSIAGTQSDWGVYAQNNGGVTYGSTQSTAAWRTLTQTEWDYLLTHNNSWGLATITVGGTQYKGMVLRPYGVQPVDGSLTSWVDPYSGCYTPGSGSGWTTNTYTESQWSEMESAGAIFLPVTGFRMDDAVTLSGVDGEAGNYWTASAAGDGYTGNNVRFNSSGATASNTKAIFYGLAVRLVANK